jgi:hypothetical protein
MELATALGFVGTVLQAQGYTDLKFELETLFNHSCHSPIHCATNHVTYSYLPELIPESLSMPNEGEMILLHTLVR